MDRAYAMIISFFLLVVTITVLQQLITVREDAGAAIICFSLTRGSIEANTTISLRADTVSLDGTARGTVEHSFYFY